MKMKIFLGLYKGSLLRKLIINNIVYLYVQKAQTMTFKWIVKSIFKLPEGTMHTCVGSHVGMSANMFLEHRRLLTADAALRTDIAPSSATSNISILLVTFKSSSQFFLRSRILIELNFVVVKLVRIIQR